MNKTLLINGTIIDGTGRPRSKGGLLICGDRIENVGNFEAPVDCLQLNCTGLTITPGFIDAHNHLDLQVLEDRSERTKQGITGEVVGNCGFSPYPSGTSGTSLREFANGILCGKGDWGWTSAREYIEAVKDSKTTVGVASLVGHGSLRIVIAGNRFGALEETEVEEMCRLLDASLNEGAAGFSSGLMYVPGSSAPFSELERLCRVVSKHRKIYATHIRSYSSHLVEAVEEQIELARRTECRLQISHLQAVGAANWPEQARALEKIEIASAEGMDIAFDCYPYVAGSSVLTMLMPQWTLDGGIEWMLRRLRDLPMREKIAAEVVDSLPLQWSDIIISGVANEHNKNTLGRSLDELAASRATDPVEVMLDLLVEETGRVNVILFNQSNENLKRTLTHPLSMIVSDGFYVNGTPHPRLFGTFPRFLGTYCRDLKWLTLEEGIRKITDLPAQRFGFEKTGQLKPGYSANVTVFDAEKIDSPATFELPTLEPVGVKHVFRRGKSCL